MRPTREAVEAADAKLRDEYQRFTVGNLRWDYMCNIREDTRAIIREELKRRGVSMKTFEAYGRGVCR